MIVIEGVGGGDGWALVPGHHGAVFSAWRRCLEATGDVPAGRKVDGRGSDEMVTGRQGKAKSTGERAGRVWRDSYHSIMLGCEEL